MLEKKVRVCVLIDNLDKPWIRGDNLELLSNFLFGLLSVSRVISEEFQKRGGATWRPVHLSLLVFLRSDIFSYIKTEARERDKLVFKHLDWNDPRLLQRVIEERFLSSLEETISPEEIWQQFFVAAVKEMPTKDYLVSSIIPRPRDIIYLCKTALAHAVNHQHTRVEESDILQAEQEYSYYAFNSLEAETSTQLDHCEELLYEFAGVDEIVTRNQIEGFIKKVNIPEDKIDYAIKLLCDSTFLGLEVESDKFEFIYDEDRKKVLQTLARKTAETRGEERFRINIPFHSYLKIKTRPNMIQSYGI